MKKTLYSLIIGVLLFSGLANADTFYLDGSCTNNGDGTAQSCAEAAGGVGALNTWSAVASLIAALSGNTIYVKAGTYTHNADTNFARPNTIIGCDSNWQPVTRGTPQVIFRPSAYTITNAVFYINTADSNGTGLKKFQGIIFDSRNLTGATKSFFQLRHTGTGADKDTTVEFENCVFTSNNVTYGYIFFYVNSATYQMNLTLTNCTITDLIAGSHVLYYNKVGDFTVNGGSYTFKEGTNVMLFNLVGWDPVKTEVVTIRNASFTNPAATGTAGTAFVGCTELKYNRIVITNNTFAGTHSSFNGGMIRIGTVATVGVANLLVEGNTFDDSYSIATRSSSNSPLVILPGLPSVSVVRGNLFKYKSTSAHFICQFGTTTSTDYDNDNDGLVFERNSVLGPGYYGASAATGNVAVNFSRQKAGHFRYNYFHGVGAAYYGSNVANDDWNYVGGFYGNVVVNPIGNVSPATASVVVLGGQNFSVVNNTFYKNVSTIPTRFVETGSNGTQPHNGTKIYNNISFMDNNASNYFLYLGGTFTYHSADNNCYYTASGNDDVKFYYSGTTFNTFADWKVYFDAEKSIFANPKFQSDKYWLMSASPCLKLANKQFAQFESGLAKSSSFTVANGIKTKSRNKAVAGGYAMRYMCLPGSLILCSYQ